MENKKIKVLQVTGSLAIGGLQTVALNCYRCIDREKYVFDYLVYGEQIGEYESEIEQLGGKVIHIPSPRNRLLDNYKNILKTIQKNGPYDIVHSHTFYNTGIVLAAAKKCGVKKCIAHSHSGKRADSSRLSKKIYNVLMKRSILHNADVYCACSEKAGNYLYGKAAFSSKKGVILPNSIDYVHFSYSDEHRREIRTKFQISENERIVGSVGHLTMVKNHSFLLEVFANIVKVFPNYRLMIVGDGELRDTLHNQARDLNLSDYIIWTGERMDVNKVLSAMDIFVMPSIHEGFGIALLEAQANGLPCLVAKGAVPNQVWINDNHCELELDDMKSWVEKITEMNRSNTYNNSDLPYSMEEFSKVLNLMYLIN